MATRSRWLLGWFASQPVGIRAALITSLVAALAIVAVEWSRERRDERTRLEQRQFNARRELVSQVVPQLRRLVDLTAALGASVTIHGKPDSALVDSLLRMVEPLLVSNEGTGASIARVFTDSIGISYSMTIFAADTLFHQSFGLLAADTVRTKPEALNALRESVLRHVETAGRLAARVQNAMVAEQ